jgi:hypothetical protein
MICGLECFEKRLYVDMSAVKRWVIVESRDRIVLLC